MKNMKIDANGTEIRVMDDMVALMLIRTLLLSLLRGFLQNLNFILSRIISD